MLDTPAPESPQELLDRAEVNGTQIIVQYDHTVAALATLTQKYGSAVFDCAVPKQDKAARAARRELVALRTSLETKRKEIKAPFLETTRLIDSKAKFIETAILAIEEPIDAQIKIEEGRKEALKLEAARIEFERVSAIKAKIAAITRVRIDALSMSVRQLEAVQAAEFDFSEFAEFEPEARAAYDETAAALQSMLQVRLQQEEEAEDLRRERALIAKERERMEREAAEAKDKQYEELAEQRAAMAAERAEQDRLRAIETAALEAERAEVARHLAEIKAKQDEELAQAQAAEREKNEAAEIAKARLCNAAPLMLEALKYVAITYSEHPDFQETTAQLKVMEAILAAEGVTP